jgi:hypothetical protein
VKELDLNKKIITITEAENMMGISSVSVLREINVRSGIWGLVPPS